ncbi:MAG: hypothetical protein JO276_06480 [Sphingomonadaceae bacterium]|nr:hypothetical protein [Sphingomonadaceae bacterium]
MSTIIEHSWALPEIDTIFEFVFAMAPGEAPEGHRVTVTCRWPPVEKRVVILNAARPTPVCLHFGSGYELRGKMEVIHQGDRRAPELGVFADLSYDWRGQPPVQHFEGLIFLRAAPGPPIPPVPPPPCPPPPDDDGEDDPPIVTPHDELFPYLYVRQWPKPADEELDYGFFAYPWPSPPADSFIAELGSLAPQGRAAMESLALAFIDGEPPWQGQYVFSRASLQGPVGGFAALALGLQQPEPWRPEWAEQLCRDLETLLRLYGETGLYLLSADYEASLERVWQSYFALAVLLGYNQALLADLGLTLWLANAAAKALVVEADGRLRLGSLDPEQQGAVAHASLVLPAGIFPLPAGAPLPPPLPPARGWVEPYAVGDLQMVRQRLLRYAAGEIARIENVMRGERREVSTRQGRQRLDVEQKSGEELQLIESEDADARLSLLEEASRTVAGQTLADSYDNFTTSYGPPTQGTVSGTLSRITTAGLPGSDDATRFAREILGKAINRISRKVGTVRASSSLSHAEEAVVSVIDNAAGGGNLCAIYRWVNKIYEACVVNYGNRLLMEFVLLRPAAELRDRPLREGRSRHLPPPPAEAGLRSFEDVNPRNYARLCAAYGVTDIVPPPGPKFAAASLRAGDEIQVALPPGYCACAAAAGCVPASGAAAAPAILVGYQLVAADGSPTPLTSRGEASAIPVSAAAPEAGLSPPGGSEALVNVEIECAPSPRCMDEWQIRIYGAIVTAYEASLERRRTALADGALPIVPRSPLACRDLARRALRHGCTELLLEQAAQLTGSDAPPLSPPVDAVDRPRFLQFLDEALEWPEMSWTLQHDGPWDDGGGGEEGGGDAPFGRFLHADRARVLVPVRPEHVLAFLYFFASGMIWDGPDRLVAVNSADVPIVDDLKRAARRPERERRVGCPWEVVVPTAMQIIDDSDLPAGGRTLAAATMGDAS